MYELLQASENSNAVLLIVCRYYGRKRRGT